MWAIIARVNTIKQLFRLGGLAAAISSVKLRFNDFRSIFSVKNSTRGLSTFCGSLLSSLKANWLRIENHLRAKGQRLEKRLAESIKAPFKYMGRYLKAMAGQFAGYVSSPFRRTYCRCTSIVDTCKKNVSNIKTIIANWIQGRSAYLKSRLWDFRVRMLRLRPLSISAHFKKCLKDIFEPRKKALSGFFTSRIAFPKFYLIAYHL